MLGVFLTYKLPTSNVFSMFSTSQRRHGHKNTCQDTTDLEDMLPLRNEQLGLQRSQNKIISCVVESNFSKSPQY